MLVTLILGGWLAATFYIAEQTENKIRTSLVESSAQSSDTFFLELITYERSLFAAQMDVRLLSNDQNINDALSNLVFRVDIKHGPIVFNDTNLQLATANLQMYLDQSQLNDDAKVLLARLFGDDNPFSAKVLVDYDLRRHYRIDSAALEYEVSDMKLSISAGSAEGVYESDANAIPISLEMDEIVFKQGDDLLESTNNHFMFSLQGKHETDHKLNSTRVATNDANYLDSSINLKNLQLSQLFDVVNRYEDRHNLDQQIQWTLEIAAQYQEGQDRLLELFRKQDAKVLPSADNLVSQLLKQGMADISYLHKVDHQDTSIAYNDLVNIQK